MLTLTATIGVAAGIAVLVISLLLLAWCCLRSRRQQKSMNFDKVSRKTLTHSIEMVSYPSVRMLYSLSY